MDIKARVSGLRKAESRVSRLERAVRKFDLTVRKFERDRDGIRLVLAKRGSGNRGGRTRCHRVFWLGEPYTVDMERRLLALPAE